MKLEDILNEVVEILGVPLAKIEGSRRKREITIARFCYYIIAESYDYKQEETTKLTFKDRTAVRHAMCMYKNICEHREFYPQLYDAFKKVEHLMCATPKEVKKEPVSRISQLEAKVLELELIVNELKNRS